MQLPFFYLLRRFCTKVIIRFEISTSSAARFLAPTENTDSCERMNRLFRTSKFQKFIDSFKSLSLRVVLLKLIFARIFFSKIIYITAALTILLPCFTKPVPVDPTEMARKHKNSFLMTTDGAKEDITTLSGGVDTGPVNKELFVEKLRNKGGRP